MAARKHTAINDKVRERIRTVQLVNRLQEHVLANLSSKAALKKKNMTPTQVAAAKVLLGKALPDLATLTLAGDADNPVALTGRVEVVFVDPPAKQDEPQA